MFTYIIKWDQDDEGRHKMCEEKENIQIIESQTNTLKEIKSKSPRESHKTFGCFKNPMMDPKDQIADIKNKLERLSQLTCSYGLSQQTVRLAYFSVFLPAVQYPLTSSSISKKALDAVQAKATRRFLTAMGYHPNTPRIVAYAPKQMGGIGMQRLYTNQGVKNTITMLKHLRAKTTVGKLCYINVE